MVLSSSKSSNNIRLELLHDIDFEHGEEEIDFEYHDEKENGN